MRERFRDKTRDELAATLQGLGVDATLAERGRAEEKVQNSWHQRSLGVIDLSEGPIRWINVLKQDGSDKSPPRWWTNFCIPDDRLLSGRREIKIKTIRKKSFPMFGKVVDVNWKGSDHATGLASRLSNDEAATGLALRAGNLEVRSHSEEFQGWTLEVDRKLDISAEDWEAIQKIADILLSSIRLV